MSNSMSSIHLCLSDGKPQTFAFVFGAIDLYRKGIDIVWEQHILDELL